MHSERKNLRANGQTTVDFQSGPVPGGHDDVQPAMVQ
jgi:hypothetical protein